MRIEINELIAEYFETIKKDYPQLSYDNIKEIITAPWHYTKECMESGELDRIRLKYFGVFYVNIGRAKRMLEETKYRFSKQYITPKQYFKLKGYLESYINNYKKEDNED